MKEAGKYRSGFYYYFIELFIIVCGITLSFFLNEWRQERLGNEAMRLDLTAIQRNLEADRVEIADLLVKHEQGVEALGDLLAYAEGEGDPAEFPQTVVHFMQTALSFFPATGARKAMVTSGNARWLQDRGLASALSDYYDHLVPRILDNNRVMDKLVTTDLIPWLGGVHPHIGEIEEWEKEFSIDIVRNPDFGQRIGANVAHAIWYVELLKRSKAKVDAALEAIEVHLQQK